MAPKTAQAEDLHPLARRALKAVEVHEDGAQSAIGEKRLADLTRLFRSHLDDETLFVHLAVLHLRLRGSGLRVAADQMLELARVGLQPSALAQTMEQLENAGPASAGPRPRKARVSAPRPRSEKASGVRLRPSTTRGGRHK